MTDWLTAITESWYWRYFFSHFGWVDWMLCIFILTGVLLGIKNGLSRELPRLVEGLVSLYVTMQYHTFFAAWLARETPWPETYGKIFTFLFLWFLSALLLRLLFEIVGRLVHLQIVAPFEWLGGVLVGGFRYFLLFCLASYFLILLPLDWTQSSYKVNSWSGAALIKVPVKIQESINRVLPFIKKAET